MLPVPKEIAVDEVEVVVEDEVIFTQYFTHLLNILLIFKVEVDLEVRFTQYFTHLINIYSFTQLQEVDVEEIGDSLSVELMKIVLMKLWNKNLPNTEK